MEKYLHLSGWGKIKSWRSELKSLMRSVGRASGSGGKNKEEKLHKVTALYLEKSKLLLAKLFLERNNLPSGLPKANAVPMWNLAKNYPSQPISMI